MSNSNQLALILSLNNRRNRADTNLALIIWLQTLNEFVEVLNFKAEFGFSFFNPLEGIYGVI